MVMTNYITLKQLQHILYKIANIGCKLQYILLYMYKHSIITKPFTVYPKYLEIPAGKAHEHLLQAELIAPNILTATDSVAVTLTIAMDTVLAKSIDHDPVFGISDRTTFVGFMAWEPFDYKSVPPCFSVEGVNTNGLLESRRYDSNNPKVNSRDYSSEITIRIKPNDQWGSCHTEHDEGNVGIVNYQYKLDLTKGLYLKLYRHNAAERYRIKYIETDVYLD